MFIHTEPRMLKTYGHDEGGGVPALYHKKKREEQSWLGCRIVNTTGDKPGAISTYLLYAILKATPRGGDEIEMALIVAVITCQGNTRMEYVKEDKTEERMSEKFACL